MARDGGAGGAEDKDQALTSIGPLRPREQTCINDGN